VNLAYWKKEVATLRAELREARAAGKRQYEENVSLIARCAALESAMEEARAAVREATRVVREARVGRAEPTP
jgi:predicted  nucleic acid-binding Zn-ribbon protein